MIKIFCLLFKISFYNKNYLKIKNKWSKNQILISIKSYNQHYKKITKKINKNFKIKIQSIYNYKNNKNKFKKAKWPFKKVYFKTYKKTIIKICLY